MRLRFSETEISLKTDSLLLFVKSFILLLLMSPYLFLNEVSIKIVFLRRDLIKRILQVSVLIGAVTLLLMLLVQLMFAEFQLISGTFPFLFMLLGEILLLLTYVMFSSYNSILYDKLHVAAFMDIPFLHQDGAVSKNPVSEDSKPFSPQKSKDTTVKESVYEEVAPIVSPIEVCDPIDPPVVPVNSYSPSPEFLSDSLWDQVNEQIPTAEILNEEVSKYMNPIVYQDDSVIAFQHRYNEKCSKLGDTIIRSSDTFSTADIATLEQQMNDSLDPSKFIPESLLRLFASSAISADLEFLDELTIGVIPSDFRTLS